MRNRRRKTILQGKQAQLNAALHAPVVQDSRSNRGTDRQNDPTPPLPPTAPVLNCTSVGPVHMNPSVHPQHGHPESRATPVAAGNDQNAPGGRHLPQYPVPLPTKECVHEFLIKFRKAPTMFFRLQQTVQFYLPSGCLSVAKGWMNFVVDYIGGMDHPLGRVFHSYFVMWQQLRYPMTERTVSPTLDCSLNPEMLVLSEPGGIEHVCNLVEPCGEGCYTCANFKNLVHRCLYLIRQNLNHQQTCTFWKWFRAIRSSSIVENHVMQTFTGVKNQVDAPTEQPKIVLEAERVFTPCAACPPLKYCPACRDKVLEEMEDHRNAINIIKEVHALRIDNRPTKTIWCLLDRDAVSKIDKWRRCYMDNMQADRKDKVLYWGYLIEICYIYGGLDGWIVSCEEQMEVVRAGFQPELGRLIATSSLQVQLTGNPNELVIRGHGECLRQSAVRVDASTQTTAPICHWDVPSNDYKDVTIGKWWGPMVTIPRNEALYASPRSSR